MDVGLCELRDGLIRHLAQLRTGRVVAINDHSKLAGRVVPNALERLVAEGRAGPARQHKRPALRGVRASGTVSDLVAEQRRDVDLG